MPAVVPGFNVVDLAVIERHGTSRPHTLAELRFEHGTLFIVCDALGSESIDRPSQRMHEDGLPMLGQRALNILRARDHRAVTQLNGDLLTLTIYDAVELVKINNRRGRYFNGPAARVSGHQRAKTLKGAVRMRNDGAKVLDGHRLIGDTDCAQAVGVPGMRYLRLGLRRSEELA